MDTMELHGPELPHHGDVANGTATIPVRNCGNCGAVETGLPHDWHDPGCPRYAAAPATRFFPPAACPFHPDRAQVRNGMCGDCAEKADDAR